MSTHSRCKSCPAEILFATTKTGKSMPVEHVGAGKGNITVSWDKLRVQAFANVGAPGSGDHVAHFARCPNAAQHRRRT